MLNEEDYYIDYFDYNYTIESLFKNGSYHLVMNSLSGTDRAISNFLAKGSTIKDAYCAFGYDEEFMKERIRYIANLYDIVYNNNYPKRGR